MQSPHHRRAFIVMTIVMVLTFSRASVVTYFPHLEMYGGLDEMPGSHHGSAIQFSAFWFRS